MNAFWNRILSAMSGQPGGYTATWEFTREHASLRRARRLARQTLAGWGHADQVDVVELLVSELVGNAMKHAHGRIRLTLSVEDGLLRCEVEDSGCELPRMRETTLDDESGRGLQLVDMLSCCWGGDRTASGKVVWFELPATGAEAGAEARAHTFAQDPVSAFMSSIPMLSPEPS